METIKFVFDINVYVNVASAPPKNTLACFSVIAENPNFRLIASEFITGKAIDVLTEKVLNSKIIYSEKRLEQFKSLLIAFENRSKLIYQDIGDPLGATIGDLEPEDSHIYNLARKSGASIIVTSDSDFERVRNFDRSIAIISPARFIKLTSPKPPTKPSPGLQFGMNPLDFQSPSQDLGFDRQI